MKRADSCFLLQFINPEIDSGPGKSGLMQEEMIQKYLASIEAKGLIIKTLWEKFLQGDKTVLDEIRLHAHSLKGSGATFGFPEISEA